MMKRDERLGTVKKYVKVGRREGRKQEDKRTCESGDQARERTAIACEVYVTVRACEARSKM